MESLQQQQGIRHKKSRPSAVSHYLEGQVLALSCQISSRHPLPGLPNPMHCMSHEDDRVVDGTKQRRYLQHTQRCQLQLLCLWQCLQ